MFKKHLIGVTAALAAVLWVGLAQATEKTDPAQKPGAVIFNPSASDEEVPDFAPGPPTAAEPVRVSTGPQRQRSVSLVREPASMRCYQHGVKVADHDLGEAWLQTHTPAISAPLATGGRQLIVTAVGDGLCVIVVNRATPTTDDRRLR
jgi:hypothetical protein